MLDLIALRAFIDAERRRRRWTAGEIHTRYRATAAGRAEGAGRTLFHKWFSDEEEIDAQISARLTGCIAGLADALSIEESAFWIAAGVIPSTTETMMGVIAASREIRKSVDRVRAALDDKSFSSAAEALVLDRVIRHGLDYRVEVRPIIRGNRARFHFRSWIVLQPVQPARARQRQETRNVEGLDTVDRREYIRKKVITEEIWRSLGLRWRDPLPIEWEGDPADLFIELPVEEANLVPDPVYAADSPLSCRRILCLSGLWSHAESLSVHLAKALQWGTYDLRYLGFSTESDEGEKLSFIRRKLIDDEPFYVWSIPESAEVLRELSDELSDAAARSHLIVWVRYGPITEVAAAAAWRTDAATISRSNRVAEDIVRRINQSQPVITVTFDDADLVDHLGGVDRDKFADQVYYAAADVLNRLHRHRLGPPIKAWGERFADLRHHDEPRAAIPPRASERLYAEWVPQGELK